VRRPSDSCDKSVCVCLCLCVCVCVSASDALLSTEVGGTMLPPEAGGEGVAFEGRLRGVPEHPSFFGPGRDMTLVTGY